MRAHPEQYLTLTLRWLSFQGVPVKLEYWPETDCWWSEVGDSFHAASARDTTPTKALKTALALWKSLGDG